METNHASGIGCGCIGALLGAILLGLLSVGVASEMIKPRFSPDGMAGLGRFYGILFYGVVGALVGMILGAVVGYLIGGKKNDDGND